MDLGERIKHRRKALGMTQEKLGYLCGEATKGAVSQWEKGITRPTIDALAALSQALECSVDWLLLGTDSMEGDMRTRKLAQIFSRLDDRGKDAVFRVAESESSYSLSSEILPKKSA